MHKRNIWLGLALILVLVAVAAFAAACGGDDTTTTAAGTPTTQGGTATTQASSSTTQPEATTTTASASAPQGGTLSYYLNEPVAIEPVDLEESEGTEVGQALFDSLAQYDFLTSKILPAAADSWEANADATVWTFHLNKNDKFSDGTAVTAKDFIYSWTRLCTPANKSNVAYHLEPVKGFDELQAGTATTFAGLKAVDDYTFEVTLKYSYADFEYVVAHPTLAPVPQAAVEKLGAQGYGEAPVGNGPFMMAPNTKWVHDQSIQVVKNPNYYGKAANIDGIDFKIFKDPETAYLEFQAGNLDFTAIPTGQIDATKTQYGVSDDGYTATPGKQTLLGPELAIYYVDVNVTPTGLTNPDLRQAISLAINRQAICDTIMEGTRVPADNFVPPGIVGYEAGAWKYAKYDVEAAKAALAKAGFPGGTGAPEITLSCNSGGSHEQIMAAVQADLQKIGLTVKTDLTEWAAYLPKLQEHKYQIGRMGWIADYPIIDNFIFSMFQSKSSNNYSGYADAAVDQAMLDARAMTNGDARVAAWQTINKTIGDTVPAIPLMAYRHGRVASERVANLIFSPMDLADFANCSIVAK